jgi:hypothetical protein
MDNDMFNHFQTYVKPSYHKNILLKNMEYNLTYKQNGKAIFDLIATFIYNNSHRNKWLVLVDGMNMVRNENFRYGLLPILDIDDYYYGKKQLQRETYRNNIDGIHMYFDKLLLEIDSLSQNITIVFYQSNIPYVNIINNICYVGIECNNETDDYCLKFIELYSAYLINNSNIQYNDNKAYILSCDRYSWYDTPFYLSKDNYLQLSINYYDDGKVKIKMFPSCYVTPYELIKLSVNGSPINLSNKKEKNHYERYIYATRGNIHK